MIELRLLRYLVAVADAGTLAAAARDVHVTQPSLSRQLRALEQRLGFAVFDRSGMRLTLTPAGRSFVHEARDLLRSAQETEAAAQRLASGIPKKITISAPMTTITDMLAPFMAQNLTDRDPHIEFLPVLPAEGFTPLESGADIAIASAPPLERYTTQLLGQIPLFAQFRAGHPWSTRSQIHVRELAQQPLVLLTHAHRTRNLLDTLMNDADATYLSYVECHVPKAAQALAAAGRGVVVLTDLPVFDLVAAPLYNDNGAIKVRIHAAWERNHYAAHDIGRLAQLIRDHYTARLTATSRIGRSAAP
ncbi:hypothetical protein AZG88_42620 [Rhodococcus sp. LB1]|nr:hypothetical protein AZG88_42620 [Rhodococcus sp. LB1]